MITPNMVINHLLPYMILLQGHAPPSCRERSLLQHPPPLQDTGTALFQTIKFQRTSFDQ